MGNMGESSKFTKNNVQAIGARKKMKILSFLMNFKDVRERSGSVVECLTQDRRAAS